MTCHIGAIDIFGVYKFYGGSFPSFVITYFVSYFCTASGIVRRIVQTGDMFVTEDAANDVHDFLTTEGETVKQVMTAQSST